MEQMTRILQMLEANYPESLKTGMIVNGKSEQHLLKHYVHMRRMYFATLYSHHMRMKLFTTLTSPHEKDFFRKPTFPQFDTKSHSMYRKPLNGFYGQYNLISLPLVLFCLQPHISQNICHERCNIHVFQPLSGNITN